MWFSSSGGRPLNYVGYESAWVGAQTPTGVSVVVRADANTNALRLAVTTGGVTSRTAAATMSNRTARFDLTGLTPDTAYTYQVEAGGTAIEGTFGNNGQFGTMQVSDSGGSSISVTWRGFDSAGTQLVSHTFSVSV